MPCEGPPARHADAPPWGTARCSGGQRKLGQIKVIKDLRINNAFILDLLTILAESAERREGGPRWTQIQLSVCRLGDRDKSLGCRQVFEA